MTDNHNLRVIHVTPAMARKWLGQNTNNRKIRRHHVNFLIGVIHRGEWALTNDAICFASDGTLLNGQHRLHAIIESGQTLPIAVMDNVSRNAQLAMDTGAKRQASEQMQILGIAGASAHKAALCRAILSYDDEDGPQNRVEAVSNAEIIELAEGDTALDIALGLASSLSSRIPLARNTAISLGYYLLVTSWPEKVSDFHETLREGIDLGVNSPVRRFRNLMLSGAIRQHHSVDRRKMLALFIKAFNYWIDGKEIELLTWRSDEPWPVPYTQASYTKAIAARERGFKSAATRRAKANAR